MVFQSSKLAADYKFEFQQNFEEINITSFDGTKLNGLLFKAENAKGLIFYLHGNSGTLETWGNIAPNYTNLGYDIFILDYRGFGKSEGKINSEEQVYNDISAAYKHLLTKYKESKIIITGYSIGTGPATYLASNNKPKALILQAPYYNFLELSSSKVPFFPDFLKKFKFETNVFITKIKAPIYIFHGKEDRLIGYENSVRLSKLLKPTDHFYSLENQDHIGINENEDFLKELEGILK
jgi:alpha-beta hydrolase superfamily lysophospholipase